MAEIPYLDCPPEFRAQTLENQKLHSKSQERMARDCPVLYFLLPPDDEGGEG